MKILVIDIGGTTLKYVVVKNGKLQLPLLKKDTYQINVNQLIEMIISIFSKFKDLDGMAIASPGAIENNKYVNFWTAIKGLSQGFHFASALEKKGINVPISIINDANAAAFGEYTIDTSQNQTIMSYIGVGSGIGCGVIYQNVIIEGYQGYGSEFASAFEIWNQKTSQYESPQDHGGFHAIIRKWKQATNNEITGEEIFAQYDNQNALAIAIIQQFYQAIAKTLFNIVMTINPEIIILGGGLAYRKKAIAEIKHEFAKIAKVKGIPMKILNLKRTSVYDKATIYGAYYYHLKVYGQYGS